MTCNLILQYINTQYKIAFPLRFPFDFFFVLDECIFVLLSDALSRIQKPSFALCHELMNKKSVEYFYTFISNIRRRHIFLIPKTDYILFQARLVFFFPSSLSPSRQPLSYKTILIGILQISDSSEYHLKYIIILHPMYCLSAF